MPQVSVITPIYIDIPDKIVWLDEMLQSVLAQTMQNWEVILVDDFSPLLIGELKWKYTDEKRFRWFRTGSNSGPALTRNVAVALAESEAILPLDSDDGLATNPTLERMYDEWVKDKTKSVYGNLQRLRIKNGEFQKEKTYVLDPYVFKNAMNLNGIIPVTAMHSIAAHNAVGGWKAALEFGREDVEYNLNMGKLGFCGQKIEEVTLLYREHNTSRDYKLKRDGLLKKQMEDQIREIHADLFGGRFPVGCCDQPSTSIAPAMQQGGVMSTVNVGNTVVTRLPEGKYREDDTWWVEYYGNKKATTSIFGIGRKEKYTVFGTGHVFQILVSDKDIFAKRSREYRHAEKLEYLKPAMPPVPEPRSQAVPQPQAARGLVPDLAVIERLDKIAMESRGLPVVTEEQLPEPSIVKVGIDLAVPERDYPAPQLPTDTKIVDAGSPLIGVADPGFSLGDLDLGAFKDTLELEGWTVQMLANAEIGDLTGYKNIGNSRAKTFIDQARELINET